jgi:hypothetical protein
LNDADPQLGQQSLQLRDAADLQRPATDTDPVVTIAHVVPQRSVYKAMMA